MTFFKYLFVALSLCLFINCNKSKFKTEPQVKFVSFTPDKVKGIGITGQKFCELNLEVTDLQGDLGNWIGVESQKNRAAYIFIRKVKPGTTGWDSFPFPARINGNVSRKGKVELQMDLTIIASRLGNVVPSRPGINRDTIQFEIYAKDTAKHKGPTITTGPLYWEK